MLHGWNPSIPGIHGKELLYDALLDPAGWMIALLRHAVGASALLGAAGLAAGVSPFFGPPG